MGALFRDPVCGAGKLSKLFESFMPLTAVII
jgi:hypothetical protein